MSWREEFSPADGWRVPQEVERLVALGVLTDVSEDETIPSFAFPSSLAGNCYLFQIDHPEPHKRPRERFSLTYVPSCDLPVQEICKTEDLSEALEEVRLLENLFRAKPRLHVIDEILYEQEDCMGCGRSFMMALDEAEQLELVKVRCPYCDDEVVLGFAQKEAIERADADRRASAQAR